MVAKITQVSETLQRNMETRVKRNADLFKEMTSESITPTKVEIALRPSESIQASDAVIDLNNNAVKVYLIGPASREIVKRVMRQIDENLAYAMFINHYQTKYPGYKLVPELVLLSGAGLFKALVETHEIKDRRNRLKRILSLISYSDRRVIDINLRSIREFHTAMLKIEPSVPPTERLGLFVSFMEEGHALVTFSRAARGIDVGKDKIQFVDSFCSLFTLQLLMVSPDFNGALKIFTRGPEVLQEELCELLWKTENGKKIETAINELRASFGLPQMPKLHK